MEQTHKAKYGERAWSFLGLSEHDTLPECVYQPKSSPNPLLSGFYEDFITQAWLIQIFAIDDQRLLLLNPKMKK